MERSIISRGAWTLSFSFSLSLSLSLSFFRIKPRVGGIAPREVSSERPYTHVYSCVRHDCATVCRERDTIIQTGETIPCIKS